MLVVIRSPRGEAEVSVAANDAEATMADLVATVTGQPAPALVYVDGRAVATSIPLDGVALFDGSVVDQAPPTSTSTGDIALTVIAGPATGTSRPLTAGHYRIGPGTKHNVAELTDGVGLDGRLELHVDASGGVRVGAPGGQLDGHPVQDTTAWSDEHLVVGSRAFALHRVRPDSRRPFLRARDGVATFHRPPGSTPSARPPTLPDTVEWARLADGALWQLRPGQPGAFVVPVGVTGDGSATVVVDLAAERGVGIIASVDDAQDHARAALLIAATTLHGPRDIEVVVCTSPARAASWEWAKWLPHARTSGPPCIMTSRAQVRPWADAIRRSHRRRSRPNERLTIVVIDGVSAWRDRSAPLRPLLGDLGSSIRLLALCQERTELPAGCTTLVTIADDATAIVEHLQIPRTTTGVVPTLVDRVLAEEVARLLAPLEDPDLPSVADDELPTNVPILPLIGMPEPTADAVRASWLRNRGRPIATLGVALGSTVRVDLALDGPHAIFAGSPGAGTSELLRTFIVGLAATASPDDLNMMLVDVGDGSTFGACTELAHVVATVTDLDDALVLRIVRSLRAEAQRREDVLDTARVASIDEYRRDPRRLPLPRLVVVFDALDRTYDVVAGLIEIARRGRRTGIHLVLATHRPAAVTDTGLGAIAQLRVALHVNDDFESIGVIGRPDAANLSRRVPGRGDLQLDDQRPMLMQVATSAGVARPGAVRMMVRPFVVHRAPTMLEQHLLEDEDRAGAPSDRADSDLGRLVAAIGLAARAVGHAELTSPYIDPLPATVELTDLLAEHPGDGVPFGVVDLPDEHRHAIQWWQPGPLGSMLVYGASSTGPSSLLATLAIGAADRCSPDDVHLYVIAANSSGLVTLDALPHVGAVARPDDVERATALVRLVHAEVTVRRAAASHLGNAPPVLASRPAVVLMIDGIGDLRGEVLDLVAEVVAAGPGVGVCSVISATATADVPPMIAAAIPERWVMGPDGDGLLEDLGIRTDDVAPMPPGRALSIGDRVEMQVAQAAMPLAATVREIASISIAMSRPPQGLDRAPSGSTLAELSAHARYGAGRLVAPVGIDLRDGSPALLALDHGTATLVLGPPRSGRTTVLDAIARAADAADPDLPVIRLSTADIDVLAERLEPVLAGRGPRLLLVDDADLLADASLVELGKATDDDLTIVLAGQIAGLNAPEHWARPLVHTRTGILLQPSPPDGAALHVQLDESMCTPGGPGRGVLVNDGAVAPLQTLR